MWWRMHSLTKLMDHNGRNQNWSKLRVSLPAYTNRASPGPMEPCSSGISWQGTVPFGNCTILPCRIPHSDFAEGPFCRCLKGFYGAIKWTGSKVEGECLPTPKCSENITYATSLVMDTHGDGNICHAGEPLASFYLRSLHQFCEIF